MNIQQNVNGKCVIIIDGIEYESPTNPFGKSSIIVTIDKKVYSNYHELKNGKWKITFWAIINCLFA